MASFVCVVVVNAGEILRPIPTDLLGQGDVHELPLGVNDYDALQNHLVSLGLAQHESQFSTLREMEFGSAPPMHVWVPFRPGQPLPSLSFVKIQRPSVFPATPLQAMPARGTLRLLWEKLGDAKFEKVEREMRTEIVTAAVSTKLKRKESAKRMRTIQDSRTVTLEKLTLPQGVTFINWDISAILIRKVYYGFAEAAFSILKGERGPQRHLSVTGTPGTGKTVFGFYMLYRLRMEPEFSDWTIIWEEGSKSGTGGSYYFRGNEVRQGKCGDYDHLITNKTVFLVNGPEPSLRMDQNGGHVIMFTSTKDLNGTLWQFFKDTMGMVLYMPLWDLCELFLAAQLPGYDKACSDEEVMERYRRFGGSIQSVLVLYNNQQYVDRFNSALKVAKDKARISYMIGDILQEKDVSSFILHQMVVSADCTRTMVVFASRYVEEQLQQLEEQESTQRLIEYVRKNEDNKNERVLVGKRFEQLVHKLFSSDRVGDHRFQARRMRKPIATMTCPMLRDLLRQRKLPVSGKKAVLIQRLRQANFKGDYLDDASEAEVEQDCSSSAMEEDEEEEPEDEAEEDVAESTYESVQFNCKGQFKTFKRLDEIDAKSWGYFKPEAKNNPLFDAIILLGDGASALQVTVNPRHHANAKYIDELMKRYKLKRFYFVVPDTMLKTYPYQKLVLGSEELPWPCELWVLGVPLLKSLFDMHF